MVEEEGEGEEEEEEEEDHQEEHQEQNKEQHQGVRTMRLLLASSEERISRMRFRARLSSVSPVSVSRCLISPISANPPKLESELARASCACAQREQ
eukprot:3898591-Rhodomonas_salina.1